MKRFLKKAASAVIAVTMLFSASSQSIFASDDYTLYEAENAAISGSGISVRNDSSASGGKSVGMFSTPDSSVTFSITVEEAGYYDIVFSSIGIGSDKYNNVIVNGSNIGQLFSKNNVYSEYTVQNAFLNSGVNRLSVTVSWGYIYLDYIKVQKSSFSTENTYNVSKNLINPNASDSAKRLMSFICDNYGKNVISGQNCDDGLYGSEFNAIRNATGKTPAMLGMDLMRYTPCRVARGDNCKTVENAIQFSNAGGIVEIHWHWNAPDKYLKSGNDSSGHPRWWGGFYTENTNFDIEKVMNGQDNEGYNLIISDIDAIAAQLKRLKDADVPVLFRPLHEASGGWFWWGAKGSDPYIKLWKLLYTRLTEVHGLNNLIWVWNGQSASWYPGDDYVDIVGEDIYPGTHQYSPQSSKFIEVTNYSNTNKVVALTENGCLFDVDEAINAGTMWSWFCVWSGEFASHGNSISETYTELSMWKKVYQHSNVLTLDELPDLKAYPLTEVNSDIKYQTNENDMLRFVFVADLEEVESAKTASVKLIYDDGVTSKTVSDKPITSAYKSIYANGKLITAPEGKCYLISPVLANYAPETEVTVQYYLDDVKNEKTVSLK